MVVRFRDAFSTADWAKIGILLVVGAVAWFFVWNEYQKPLLDFDALEGQITSQAKNIE